MQHFVWNNDPILATFFGLSVHWYGLLFATALFFGFYIMKFIYTKENKDVEALEDVLIYITIGIVVGARLVHCLFYDPDYYLSNPMKIFAVWEGGLASHGGGLGVIIAMYLYTKKYAVNLMWMLDRLAIPTALFAFFVRMGNFMNSEIVGVQSDVPWAIIFARVDNISRHPAQLYEAFSYLIIFFILAAIYLAKKTKVSQGLLFGSFLTLVFSVRILVEFVKTRQATYAGDLAFSTGQMLSVPFLIVGLGLIFWSLKKKN